MQHLVPGLISGYLAEWLPGAGRPRGRWLSFTKVRQEASRDSRAWGAGRVSVMVLGGSSGGGDGGSVGGSGGEFL